MERKVKSMLTSKIPFIGRSSRNPVEVVMGLDKALLTIGKEKKESEKGKAAITKHLDQMKSLVFGTNNEGLHTDTFEKLVQEVYNSNVFIPLLENIAQLDFENKKDVTLIFNHILTQHRDAVEYFSMKPEILLILMRGCENPDISLNCGSMLQQAVKFEKLAKIMLYSDEFYNFFRYVDNSVFHVASDAFNTLKGMLMQHKNLCMTFLEENYDEIFSRFEKLINSENYVTRWGTLKLISELLHRRSNSNIRIKYTSSLDNLKQIMNVMREPSTNSQYEAFNVFELFLMHPEMPRPILEALLRNKEKLIEFLSNFQTDRPDSEEFQEEKAQAIKVITDLKPLP